MSERVPDLMIERLAKGELSAPEAAQLRAMLGADAERYVQAIAADDIETLARLPAARVAATVRRRLADRGAPRKSASWWIPTMAFAAASVAVWCATRPALQSRSDELPIDGDDRPGVLSGDPDPFDVVRIKGDAAFTIDRMTSGAPERLLDGARVRSGERLQVQYRAGDREQGAIVSIDGRGVATLHFPADVHASPRLQDGGLVPLDHSYELDDAPGFERFFFVTAVPGTTLDVDAVMRAAERLAASASADRGALELPAGHESTTLLLEKPTR